MSVTAALEANETAIAQDGARARVVFSTHGALDGPTHVTLTSRGHRIEVDEPEALAGADRNANPVEYALASLASCQAITYRFWAQRLGAALDGLEVAVRVAIASAEAPSALLDAADLVVAGPPGMLELLVAIAAAVEDVDLAP